MRLQEFIWNFSLLLFLTPPIFANPLSDGAADELVVELIKPESKIRGRILQSHNGNDFYAFQDIPYAESPIGENRLKPPKPKESWTGVLDTANNVKKCPQVDPTPDSLTQTEDCLVLNVYSPLKPGSNASLPVYFWIHGGAFLVGTGATTLYDPKYLIDYDIVIVTINYRLGILGFLTTDDKSIPGNLGLKDQHLAIQWVYDNIEAFGGDPKQITLGGESAGGISIGYHLLSQKTEGLIKAVIQESGTSLNTFGYQIDYKEHAFRFGKLLSPAFNSTKSEDLLDILQTASISEILNIQAQMLTDERIGFLKGSYWKPIVEDVNNPDAYVTVYMGQGFYEGNFNRVPILAGFNSEESLYFLDATTVAEFTETAKRLDDDPTLMLSNKLNLIEENKESAAQALKALYTDAPFLENTTAFIRYSSDEGYIHPTTRQADFTSQYVPVYLYQISYDSGESPDFPGAGKVAHTQELKYFWDWGSNGRHINETIQKSLLTFWTNFIKEQNPTPEADEVLQNIIWPLTNSDTLQYLNINETFSIETNPRQYRETLNVLNEVIKEPYTTY